MRQLLCSVLAVAAISIAACDAPFSDTPTDYSSDYSSDNQTPFPLDTTLTSNGFVTAEGEAERSVFSLDNEYASAYYSLLDDQTGVIVTGTVYQRREIGRSVLLWVVFPGMKKGNFTWENPLEEDSARNFVMISIDGVKYYSDSGATHVHLYRGVHRNVAGTFSGTLRTPFGDSIVVVDGRFDAGFVR